MPDALTLRPMTEADLDQLAALEQECFSDPWSRAMLEEELASQTAHFLVAEDAGGIAGYLGFHQVVDEGYIANLAVRPGRRRAGVATRLLREVLDSHAERGLSFVTLEVRQSNLPAQSLYTTLGFVPVGCRRAYYRHPTEDAILMTRFFGQNALPQGGKEGTL